MGSKVRILSFEDLNKFYRKIWNVIENESFQIELGTKISLPRTSIKNLFAKNLHTKFIDKQRDGCFV